MYSGVSIEDYDAMNIVRSVAEFLKRPVFITFPGEYNENSKYQYKYHMHFANVLSTIMDERYLFFPSNEDRSILVSLLNRILKR